MKRDYLVPLILVVAAFTAISCNSCKAESEVTSSVEILLDGVQTSWDGADLIDYPEGNAAITMLKVTVPPMCKLATHYHPVINVGYMLEGTLTVIDDKGNSKTITAGDPLVETVNTIHYGENTGDVDAVILVFYAGEEGEPITVTSETYP